MKSMAWRDSRLGFVDYLLAGIASCLAAFSAGSGLNDPEVAYFFMILAVTGTALAYVIQRFIPQRLAMVDGFLYAGFGVLAFVYRAALNGFVPGGGFPETLLLSSWLCWMLVLGCTCMWRDSTVLFQAVPGIAIFGYVGTWDTFLYAPLLFFGFLLCFATLFARAHGRDMIMKARESGYVSSALDASTTKGFVRTLRAGPWHWVAGPEWAMLSALLVVAISVIGGPFLQFSLQGLAGNVKLPPPPTVAMRQKFFGPTGALAAGFISRSGEAIGAGPHRDLVGKPIFTAMMQNAAYMKMHTFPSYTSHGWVGMTSTRAGNTLGLEELRYNTDTFRTLSPSDFVLRCLDGSYDSIPMPGNVIRVSGIPTAHFRVDGTVPNDGSVFAPNAVIDGSVDLPLGNATDSDSSNAFLAKYLDVSSVPKTVQELARSATAGAKSDVERAEAIESAISSRCIYDMRAAAVPPGSDPIEYFLFQSKRGYCDLFASAMTAMARSVNLPSRYVVGFAPFTDPAQHSGVFTYYDTDYHAWCEIYFKNIGWKIFDATDNAEVAPGAGRGSHIAGIPWYNQPTYRLSIATLVIILFGWGFIAIVRKFNLRLSIFGYVFDMGGRTRSRLPALEKSYADLIRLVESKTGKPRRPSQTPHEYLITVKPYLDGSYSSFSDATDAFVDAFYGTAELLPENVSKFHELVAKARTALKPIKRPKDPPPEE